MSMTTNKQALREKAEKALSDGDGNWKVWCEAGQKYPEIFTSSGHIVATVNGAFEVSRSGFIAAANPATVLALLDELEAAEKYAKDRSAENKDLMLTVGRLRVEKEAAEKRIADYQELISGLVGVSSSILREVDRIAAATDKGE
ncbi:ead/Ea22-like family protein [Lelliottia amnigena]|uniref:ead/Ea22-like family protein n=1 Tax=Lelliottia amnigena TaxID=61646 RepID=UPI00405661B8